MAARTMTGRRRVLLVLTYYRPHVSGLTIYVERLGRELAARGDDVTVLTSRYDRSLPREERRDGVHIVRVPVALRISKGVVMPMVFAAWRAARRHDVVSIHLPQFDGGAVAVVSRVLRRPTLLTYHCDLRLPAGIVNRLAGAAVRVMNELAARCAHRIVAYTQDYADHSAYLSRHAAKVRVVPPPVVMPPPDAEDVRAFRARHGLDDAPTIGMAARLAAEKGVEHLVDALPALRARFPQLRVVFAGPHEDVLGEAAYRDQLLPRIRAAGDAWTFAGVLMPDEMSAFYGSIDALVVSSVNSTESFGLVQVEAMLCGCPVVAPDLPGVRQPVRQTGMGLVVPLGDAGAIAAAVGEVLDHPERFVRPRDEIERRFDIAATVAGYERLFAEVAVDS